MDMKKKRMKSRIYIKNMVCPRCIATVRNIFEEMNLGVLEVGLGEVSLSGEMQEHQKEELSRRLEEHGFELLEDQKSRLIAQIKSIIIEQIHQRQGEMKTTFSALLSERLHHEYTSLSKLFSSVEGMTIERFILKQKIEKVKELIFYDQLSLSEIAYQLNYSSVAHLSSQFKKETGMTPSEFRKNRQSGRIALDSI